MLRTGLEVDRGRPPEWRIHDRTHLEVVVDYRLERGEAEPEYEWDAYFFVPESLRLQEQTYERNDVYDDFLSYVRLEVPELPVTELAGTPLETMATALRGEQVDKALYELRLFACLVRASTLSAERNVSQRGKSATREAEELAIELARASSELSRALRSVIDEARPKLDPELAEATRWIEEEVSRLLESMLAGLAIKLRERGCGKEKLTELVQSAANEAKQRRERGLDGVGTRNITPREVEHLEFRRHVLKRFTSSVLWLDVKVRVAGAWVRQGMLALAASLAMGAAFAAALVHAPGAQANLWFTATAVVLAYAVKDRLKANLQSVFTNLLSRVFPDRKWSVSARRGEELAEVFEQCGFVRHKRVPEEALVLRQATRRHAIEGAARPEKVLWHNKTFTLDAKAFAAEDGRIGGLSEVFRVNLRRWLDHTDDPKRPVVFADPDDGQIYSAMAKRVYNIAIVYRLRRTGDESAPWRRARVVVTRKGILRIDRVEVEAIAAGMPLAPKA